MSTLNIAVDDNKKRRILMTSDIHCQDLAEWYGVPYRDRMQKWVDAIRAEHEREPIDLILMLGDYSLDHWMYGGAWLKFGKSGTGELLRDYISQLPQEIPYLMIPGNHEQFGHDAWKQITGFDRDGIAVIGNCLFVLLDKFSGGLDPDHDHDGVYTQTDAASLAAVLDNYPDHTVFLAAHWIDPARESEEFCELIRRTPRIRGAFVGHSHRCSVIETGEAFGGKPIAQTGHFSYTGAQELTSTFWGFRDLVLDGETAHSRYLVMESVAMPGGTETYIPRQIVDECDF